MRNERFIGEPDTVGDQHKVPSQKIHPCHNATGVKSHKNLFVRIAESTGSPIERLNTISYGIYRFNFGDANSLPCNYFIT